MGIITHQHNISTIIKSHHNMIAFIALLLASTASALPQLLSDGGETTPADVGVVAPVVVEPLGLSSGAFDLFGNIQTSFSCEGRIYGYYANVELLSDFPRVPAGDVR